MSEFSNKAVATIAVMALCLTACAGMIVSSDDSDAETQSTFTWKSGQTVKDTGIYGRPGSADTYTVSGSVPGITFSKAQSGQIGLVVANGTPTAAGIYTVKVYDSGTLACTATIVVAETNAAYTYSCKVGTALSNTVIARFPGTATDYSPSASIPGVTVSASQNGQYVMILANGTPTNTGTYTVFVSSSITVTVTIISNTYVHTLHYDANGGTGAPSDQSVSNGVSGNTSITVSSNVPTRSGYNFLGWSTSSTAANATIFAGNSVSVSGGSTTTLYAVWKQITYNHEIVFNINGGTGTATTLSATNTNSNHIFTIPEYSIAKPYCEFQGWSYSLGGSVDVSTGQTVTVSPNASVTLYAVWKTIPVNITSTNSVEFLVTGNTYSYAVTTDVDGAVLTFSGPSWLTLSGSTLVGTPTEKGTYNVTVVATYGSMTDTQSFTVTVEDRLTFESIPTGGILATPVI